MYNYSSNQRSSVHQDAFNDSSPPLYKRPEITFEKKDEDALAVTIDADDVLMKSVSPNDLDEYIKLFGNPENTKKYREAKSWTVEYTQKRFAAWLANWKAGLPFSAFAVHIKGTNDFAGHVVLGYGDLPIGPEVAYIFHKQFWRDNRSSYIGRDFEGRSVSLQSISAVVNYYAPEIKRREGEFKAIKKPFEAVVATARLDNIGSCKILRKIGLEEIDVIHKWGSERYFFKANISDLDKGKILTS